MSITGMRQLINIQTSDMQAKEIPDNYSEMKLNDGKGGHPTSIFYNPGNGAPTVSCDKNDMCTIKGNTDGLMIQAGDNGSSLKIENGKNVQFESYGGTNNVTFENCSNTSAFGSGKSVDNFTYVDGKDNTNWNMDKQKDTVLNEKSGWFGGYSENLSTHINDGY